MYKVDHTELFLLFVYVRPGIPELPVPVPQLLAVDVLEGSLHLVLHQNLCSQVRHR